MLTMDRNSQIFSSCYKTYRDQTNEVLMCVASGIENRFQVEYMNTKQWLLVICGALVFMMQLGFAMLSAGCVRRKNVSNTLLKNLLDAAFAALAWFVIGFPLAFGGANPEIGATFVGTSNFFLSNYSNYAFFFYEYCCSASANTIIAGTLAERCRMAAYVSYCLFMVSFCYPIVAHAFWSVNGFLSPSLSEPFLGVGSIDFAGSGVVHITGGTTALIAAYILGSRKGRFYDTMGELLLQPKEIPGHSVSLQAMGTLALWFSWYGFNAGSALLLPEKSASFSLHGSVAALTAVNTALAGGSAAVSALIGHNWYNGGSFRDIAYDLPKALNGTLCGLVAVTAGCGVMEPWAAVVVGMIAGIAYLASSRLLIKFRIDDAVDAIPVHLSGGILGMLWVGFMASPNRMQAAYGTSHAGFMYTLGSGTPDASLLAAQVVGVLFIMGWVTALMFPFFLGMNYLNWLRTDTLEEIAGLDACYQVATQEDNDDLKLKIQEEFQKFKKDRQRKLERASTSDGMSLSSMGGNSVVSSSSVPKSREGRLSSVLEDNDAGDGSGDLTSADFFIPKKSSSTTSSNKPVEAV